MKTSVQRHLTGIALSLIFLLVSGVNADTWYVSTEGSPTGDGTSWGTAFDTIQAGIDATSNGDNVEIADGTYTGAGNKNLNYNGKAITVRSASGIPTRCIIDCEENGRGIYFHNDEELDSVIEGISIIRGKHFFGGSGIRCEAASPTIRNCVFRENRAISGAGIFLTTWANPLISNCLFAMNTARRGGGCYSNQSSPTLEQCKFINNSAIDERVATIEHHPFGAGMYVAMGYASIRNCIFARNTAKGTDAKGGGLFCGYGNTIIANCTFTANLASGENAVGSGLYCWYSPAITNCIFWGNTHDNLYIEEQDTSVTFCNIKDASTEPWFGEGCFDEDPLFAFPDDFHLMPGSPCIDAGTNNPEGGLPDTDHDGNPRLLDGTGDGTVVADVGAFEFNNNAAHIVLDRSELVFSAFVNESNPLPQPIEISNAGGQTLNWALSGLPDWLEASHTSGTLNGVQTIELEMDTQGLSWGTYEAELVFTAPGATNSPYSMPITLHANRRFPVPTQFTSIQAAIDAAMIPGDTIEIADGTYTGLGNTNLDFNGKPIVIQSLSGNPKNCIIDCENNAGGFYFHNDEGSTSILNGLSIVNASRASDGLTGGAIRISRSRPTLLNCIFANNRNGCLLLTHASPTIMNCIFSGNTSDYRGAGISNDTGCSPLIANCTFYDNTTPDGGAGIFNYDSSPTIVNCVLWECGTYPIYTIYHPDINMATVECCFTQADPAFEDPDGPDNNSSTWQDNDLRLSDNSPCIDAGTNLLLPLDIIDADNDGNTRESYPFDLDGNIRRTDYWYMDDTGNGNTPLVDIGAFEFQPPVPGDINDDGEVDLYDLYVFNLLINGPSESSPPQGMPQDLFHRADWNRDNHVDLKDFAIFQQAFQSNR